MTTAFTRETFIPRPPEEVWTTLTDWNLAAEWMPGVMGIVADASPTAVGTTLTFRTRGRERRGTITRFEPPTDGSAGRMTVRSVQGGVTADYRYVVEAAGEGASASSVALTADCEATGVWGLFAPLLRRAIRSADGDQLDRLARLLETR